MSVYKNYDPGEPTCRLYVKNIAKQVEEKVGAFISFDSILFYNLCVNIEIKNALIFMY